ncbi:MAG: portal protein [Prevotella sp.]
MNEIIKTRDSNSVEDILEEARQRAKFGIEAWTYNYDEAKKDVLFLSGNQWTEKEKTLREQEGRPALTLNQLPKFVDQILGDQRQNRPAIKVCAVDDDASQKVISQNGKEYSKAELYEGIIRNIEYSCMAESAYDTAFQHAVESGFGWLRVYTDYSTKDSFDQDILIKAIRDRFSVIIDPRAQELDASDMNWCLVTETMSKKEFDKKYPDAQMGTLSEDSQWWLKDDSVRVCEYFTREPAKRELLLLSTGETVYKDEVKDVLDEMAKNGITVVRSRKVNTYKVYWRKITAFEVLEGPTEWVGDTIPVIPVWGKDIMVSGQPIYRGLIRHAKDAQRMHNYWLTTVTERVALAPKAPWVGPAKAFSGYENFWNEANRLNLAYLPYNDQATSAPQRVAPAPMPTAEIQMAMQGIDEIKNTVGMFDASLGQKSNETSGRAILARQKEGDTGTFAFVDNLSRAIRRVGKILIDIIPHYYDSERLVRMRLIDGTGDNVLINRQVIDEQTGQQITIHDMSAGKYDVVVETGPSYNTQRAEMATMIQSLVQSYPNLMAVAGDLMVGAMDMPNADKISKRLKKTMPMGVLDEQEMQEAGIQPPQPQPDPSLQLAQAKIQEIQLQAQISQQEAEANLQLEQIKLEQEKIKTQALLTKTQMEAQTHAQNMQQNAGANESQIRQIVAKALADYQSGR